MASILPSNFTIEPRSSTETDRRYLLADSVAPSESASMIDYRLEDGDRTPRAHSPVSSSQQTDSSAAPSSGAVKIPAGRAAYERRDTIAAPSAAPQPYKGFPSEAHYLAALHTWAERQKYLESDKTLIGFYGEKTMEQYVAAAGPKVELGLKKKWKARKEAKKDSKGKIAAVESTTGSAIPSHPRRNTVT